MKLKVGSHDSESAAAEFQYRQVEMLKAALEKYRVERNIAKKVCGEFTFDLSVLLDQGQLKVDGKDWAAHLVSSADEKTFYRQPDSVALHEHASGTTADVYERDGS